MSVLRDVALGVELGPRAVRHLAAENAANGAQLVTMLSAAAYLLAGDRSGQLDRLDRLDRLDALGAKVFVCGPGRRGRRPPVRDQRRLW